MKSLKHILNVPRTLIRAELPARRPDLSRNALGFLLALLTVSIGCGPERLQPDDFKRRERDEIIVQNPAKPPVNDQAAAASAAEALNEPAASGPEDEFREAALTGNLADAKAKVREGVDVNAADPQGRTALQLASFDGHLDTVEWLISEKAEINHRDQFGRTALMYASTGPNIETVEALLTAGAEVNFVDQEENFTALMFASAEGQDAIVHRLLSEKADPAAADADGETAMDFAKANGHASVVELLTKALK